MSGPESVGAPAVIDAEGIHFTQVPQRSDEIVHVFFDDRRIWSFRPDRHGASASVADPNSGWLVPWPRDLRSFLRGLTQLRLETAEGAVLSDDEMRFGTADVRIAVADDHGMLLVVDPSDRLVSSFDTRRAEELQPLVDAVAVVLEALGDAGVDAFPAYGTLLGAVRSGKLIGHDNDADVGYLSRHSHPADVMLESYRLQRVLQGHGFEITRYSGAAFKVVVRDSERGGRGLDVFAGFLYEGRLMLLGEIFTPFDREWLVPLGTVELEGVELPAPAEPERLLTAMYGEQWRVPDPTFVFETAPEIHRRIDRWFRGTRAQRNGWDRRYSTSADRGPRRKAHDLTRMLHAAEPGATVVDVGCGRGQDATWLSRRKHRVVALDFSPNGSARLKRLAAESEWPVEFLDVNLLELRHTLALGARLARITGPRAMMARHFLNATTARGRRHLWRLAQMTLGHTGGRLYLEFAVPRESGPQPDYTDPLSWSLDPALMVSEAEAAGGRVVSERLFEPEGYELMSQLHAGSAAPRSIQMVVEWSAVAAGPPTSRQAGMSSTQEAGTST